MRIALAPARARAGVERASTSRSRRSPRLASRSATTTTPSLSIRFALPRASRDGFVAARSSTDDQGPLSDGSVNARTGAIDSRGFLRASVAFYAGMAVGSQVLTQFADVHPDVIDGVAAFNVDAAALYMIPLLASLSFAVTQSDKYEYLREVTKMIEESVLPAVAPLGVLGILALSCGAGVGEEALFRGFLMPWVDARLEGLGAGADVAAMGSLASTSLVFGALHAITPQYAVWATWASVLFSIESVRDGLGSAMFTHTLYDFLAFLYVIVSWMPDRESDD